MTRRECLKTAALAGVAAFAPLNIAAAAGAGAAPSRFHRQRKLARLPQGTISYIDEGKGPAVLLLHGWPLNGFHWRGVIERLSSSSRCIAPDLMGLGYSEVPLGQDLSPQAQADMVVDLLDALGIAEVDLVANDSGTGIGLLLAAGHPARTRSMLLTNGDVHTNSPPAALAPALEAARRCELDEIFEQHLRDPGFAYSEMGLGTLCYMNPRSLTPEAMQVYFAPLLADARRRHQCQAYGLAFEPNPLPAIEGQLRRFEGPVRMVWGTADVHFGVEWARWFDHAFARSTGIRFVEGGKLFFPEEQPAVVAQEALRLFRTARRA